jgi:hypothetical protein
MEEEFIPWTAFTCPQGHFEWLVMPLDLKMHPHYFKEKCRNFLTRIKNLYWFI